MIATPDNKKTRKRSINSKTPVKAINLPDNRANWDLQRPGSEYPGIRYGLFADLTTNDQSPMSFGKGEFTLEAYFQAPKRASGRYSGAYGGPIICSLYTGGEGAYNRNYTGILLAVKSNGKLLFGIGNQPKTSTNWNGWAFESKSAIKDEEWHHVACVRSANNLSMYLDGHQIEGSLRGHGTQSLEIINIDNQHSLLCGSLGTGSNFNSAFPIGIVPIEFYGNLAEIRIWKKALNQHELYNGMSRTLSRHEPGLICYSDLDFSEQKEKVELPISLNINDPPIGENVIDEGPLLLHPNRPYLITQTRLMDDFSFALDKSVSEEEKYCVVITAKKHDGSPLVNEPISVISVDKQTPIQIVGEEENGQISQNIVTDHAGQASFSIAANDLNCTLVKVQASFMESDDWMLVSPDRHAHHTLANLTGSMLRGTTPIDLQKHPKPLTPSLAGSSSDALAQAIGHLMKTVTEHEVKTVGSNSSKRSNADAMDAYLSRPSPQPFENPYISGSSFNSENDIGASHYTKQADPNSEPSYLRSISATAMPNAHWGFSQPTGGEASFNVFESEDKIHESLNGIEIEALNPAASFLHPPQNQRTRTTRHELASYLQRSIDDESWLNRLSHAVTNGEDVLIHTAKHVLEETKEVIHVVVVTAIVIENGEKKALTAVIQTVKHAVQITGALLKKFGADAKHVISYIKSVFKWSDILLSQKMLAHFVSNVPNVIKDKLPAQGQYIDSCFTSIKDTIDDDDNLNTLESHLGGHNLHKQQASNSYKNSKGVKHDYMHRLISKHLTSPQTQLNHVSNIPSDTQDDNHTTLTQKLKVGLSGTFGDAEHLAELGFMNIINLVKEVLDDAILGAKSSVDKALDPDYIDPVIEEMGKLNSAELTIPILSPLFSYITKQYGETEGEKLSIFNLTTIAAAVPFTVFYKSFNGGNAPYTKQDLDFFRQHSWDQFGAYFKKDASNKKNIPRARKTGQPPPSAEAIASWSLGFLFCTSVFTQMSVSIYNEGEIINLSFSKKLQLGLEITTQLTSVPFTAFYSEDIGPQSLELTIWFLQIPPLALNIIFKNGGKALAPINTAWGVIHLILFVGLGIFELKSKGVNKLDAELKLAGNIASTIPEIGQVVNLLPPVPTEKQIHILMYFLGLGGWLGITLGRIVLDMEEEEVLRII